MEVSNVYNNYDFDSKSTTTNMNSSIQVEPSNTKATNFTPLTTSSPKLNAQTETMDLSFATEQVTTETKSILDSVGDFFSEIGEGLKNTGAAIVDGAKSVANWALSGLKDLGSEIGKACSILASNVSTIVGDALSWAKDTAISVYSTASVIGTSVVSGIVDIGEGIVDGLAWTGGKIVEGGSWLVGKVAGLFSKDAEESVMNWREKAKTDVKEFIATDWVGKANDWFYQDTALGQAINENSYLKYDSEIAQGIRSVSETVGKIAIATAATIATGGAAAPLTLGFLFGTGEQAEKLYQENPNTTGAQELGIFVSGLGEAANWYAQGKLGQGAVGLFNVARNTGLKQTGALAINGVKSLLGNIKANGIGTTLKGMFGSGKIGSIMAVDNLADSVGIVGDNIGDWLVGNEEFNLKTAASAGGELLAAWGLNMFFDGAADYLGKLGRSADNVGGAIKQADELGVTLSQVDNTPQLPKKVRITDVPEFHSIEDISNYLRSELSSTKLSSSAGIDTSEISEGINKYIREKIKQNGLYDSIYYDLFSLYDDEVSRTLTSQIMGEVISSNRDLRSIIKNASIGEVRESIGGTLGITDETIINELSDCLLGKDFIENGYSATRDWDRFIEILSPYVDKKVAQEALSKEAVLWSKVDTKLLNQLYTTIENTTIGESLYCFEDIVFTNWNEKTSIIPQAEKLWGKLSEMYARSCSKLIDGSGKQINQLKYIFPNASDGNGFGELFKKAELPTILECGTIDKLEVVTVESPKNLDAISSKIVDISGLRTMYNNGIESGVSKEVMSELIFEMFQSLYSKD